MAKNLFRGIYEITVIRSFSGQDIIVEAFHLGDTHSTVFQAVQTLNPCDIQLLLSSGPCHGGMVCKDGGGTKKKSSKRERKEKLVKEKKLSPITYAPCNNTYTGLGDVVGKAFADGLQLK